MTETGSEITHDQASAPPANEHGSSPRSAHGEARTKKVAILRLAMETAIWLGIALGMWVYSGQFEADLEAYRYGPVSWPRAMFILMAVFAVGHFINRYAEIRRSKNLGEGGAADPQAETKADAGRGRVTGQTAAKDATTWISIGATFALPLIYLWLLPRMGFFVTTPFFIAFYMLAFRERDWRYIIGVSIGIYLVILLIFSKLLYVPLPTGNWPGFYDISNAILVLLGSA